MKRPLTFSSLVICLTVAGGWGVWKIIEPSFDKKVTQDISLENTADTPVSVNDISSGITAPSNIDSIAGLEDANNDLKNVKKWLAQNNVSKAVDHVNQLYGGLSTEQINLFKQVFFTQALQYSDSGELKKSQRLLKQASPLFESVDILDLLANVSVDLTDWRSALDALLKSSLIESRPDVLVTKLSSLSNIASQLKSDFLSTSDLTSIRQLYQSLYDSHPSYAPFQLELAFSYLALDDVNSAKPLFSAIQYDIEVGSQAQEQLAIIEQLDREQQSASLNARLELEARNRQANINRNDISVALVRVGNSFLVDSAIDGKQARLLLDTGASITSLSSQLISRLGLSATGNVVRLSTANGITESQLYLVKKLKLGRFTVNNLVVAEIDLNQNGRFQGLLGTDLLNKIGPNYSYLIDNENSRLIFRRKRR